MLPKKAFLGTQNLGTLQKLIFQLCQTGHALQIHDSLWFLPNEKINILDQRTRKEATGGQAIIALIILNAKYEDKWRNVKGWESVFITTISASS